MSCIMTTGNMCDIVYDYDDGIQTLRGIRAKNGELIPLPRPQDFVDCLQLIIDECTDSRERQR